MIESTALIAHLHAQARDQVRLAVLAVVEPVAAMHIDLALLRVEQAQAVEQLRDGA